MALKTRSRLAAFALLMLSTLACNLFQSNSESSPSVSNEENNTAPTLEPTALPSFGLAGVLVNPDNNSGLLYFNSNGQLTAEIQTPGLGSADSQDIILVESSSSSGEQVTLIYHCWDPEQAIMLNQNGNISTLRNSIAFLAMAGAAGQDAVAFSEVLIEDNVPHSYLYAGSLNNLASLTPFYDLKDEYTQMALMPVAVDADNGSLRGVWYTKTAWGIGGVDLIYPITRGLYYFDLTSEDNLLYMNEDRNFQGISADQAKAGSVPFNTESDQSMTVTDLNSGQVLQFSLKPTSDRGAGYAVFSPDSQYTAWLEASGSFASDPVSYRSVVRVGNLSSEIVDFELEDTAISQAISSAAVSFMKPVGWLDAQTLLIEARGEDWGKTYLVRFNLANQSLTLFSKGSFAGFGYH